MERENHVRSNGLIVKKNQAKPRTSSENNIMCYSEDIICQKGKHPKCRKCSRQKKK
jgi:hypothetical protein